MLNERKLTENEIEQRKIALKGLLKNKRALVKKYGVDAEKVMYGIATKQAKKKIEKMNLENLRSMIKDALTQPVKEQSPFVLAADAAKDAGKKEFEFPKGSGKMHPVTIKTDIKEINNPDLNEVFQSIRNLASTAGMDELEAAEIAINEIKIEFGVDAFHESLDEDLDVGHQDDEPGMLKAELARAGKMVQMLYKAIDKYDGQGEVDFPQWWQKKIIQANAMLDSAFDYLDGQESVAKIDAMISEEVDEKYSNFLMALRDSGVTNMFGAGPYLEAEFGLDKREARKILANWMQSLNEAMDGGQLFDYFANKGYKVKERRPDGKEAGFQGYMVSKGDGPYPQSVIFQYDKDVDQFMISQMSGYRIDQKEAMKAGMRETGFSRVVGIDSYITDGNYTPVDISVEGLKDIVDHVMSGIDREGQAQADFYRARGRTSGTIDEEKIEVDADTEFVLPLKHLIQKHVKEVLGKKKIAEEFKVGQKVTYLGNPAEITKINKEVTGDISYNVLYDKGTGKTKATNIYNKGGEIKSLEEKLTKRSSVEKHIEDFKDSDAPQFKGKSQEKRRKMAVAAYLSKKDKK